MRLLALGLVVLGLAIYAWKDWYKSLCGLVVLMAFLGHPDMPKSMFGIQGLNIWNLLLIVIILAWLAQRRREGLGGHPPGTFVLLLIVFLSVVTMAFGRLMLDRQALPIDDSTATLISEYLVNPVKWIIPGLLLFDGCRSRSRFLWGSLSILCLYLLLSVQIIRWMPIAALLDPAMLARRSHKILRAEIGYFRVDLSVILAGASWALFAMRSLVVSLTHRILLLTGAFLIVFAQALTGGRGGYFAWVVVGLTLGIIRWPRLLLLVPVLAIVISMFPGVSGRALEGLSPSAGDSSSEEIDVDTLTAGRNIIWPLVINKIAEEPILGHGRRAMERTGLSSGIEGEEGSIANPHSAYLEMLLDNGWIGLVTTLALFGYVLVKSLSLTADGRSPVFVAIGAATSALVIAQFAGSITGQSFYPREGTLGMWCAIGLMLRVSVERARLARATRPHLLEWWRPARSFRPRPGAQVPHLPIRASSKTRSIEAPL